jgi:oxygen-independent coproporphyrinogen-3 oxidase
MTAAATMPGASAPVGLYVHFPFCLSICPYCDFVVYGGNAARGPANQIERLVAALVAEIGLRAPATPGPPLASVYLGGGTPSLMSAQHVERLLAEIDARFGVAATAEVTIEVNPGPDERGDLRGFSAAGINRASIGAQSLDPTELRRLGRRHSPADVAATVTEARRAGMGNVSLDLLYDIPGQSLDTWRRTMSHALTIAPDHISAYALSLDDPDAEGITGPTGDHLPLRPGARNWRARARVGQDADLAADCYELADDMLSAAGLAWYEISNWAQAGRNSRHNRIYWSGHAWEAVGPGAHAFDGARTRRWNAARLDRYLNALCPTDGSNAVLPPGSSEVANAGAARAESVVLALRTTEGVAPRVARDLANRPAFEWAAEHGLLDEPDAERVRLSRRGRLLANELFERLMPPERSAGVDDQRVEDGPNHLQRGFPVGDRSADEHGQDTVRRVDQVQLQAPA